MSQHGRKSYSASRSRRTSRQVNERMVGSHVSRSATPRASRGSSYNAGYIQAAARRARLRRFAVGAIAVIVVLAIAFGAGFIAFRGTVGGELALRDSDAADALVAVRSDQPSYALITAELGAVAAPLENDGPDILLLARLDAENRTLALVNVPCGLQITADNQSDSVSSLAQSGDAALIKAIATFAKVDISHFVKLEAGDVGGLVDALGGVEVDITQAIDDPHAGRAYIPKGANVLGGEEALTFLRATNLEYGSQDQMANQLKLASTIISKLFASEGSFTTRLESVDAYFQTDYALGELEGINAWFAGVAPSDITCATVPGYYTAVTNVSGSGSNRYIGSASDMATLLDDLDNGRAPSVGSVEDVALVDPSGFVVDVQNGTITEGAASAAAGLLKSEGFRVGDVGNAEQPVFDETLVVYKGDDEGLARAKTVIEAMGVGRAVEKSSFYTFEHDVLLIVGADNKPVS